MSKRVLGLAAVLVAIACAAGGYAIGAANAPTEDDAAAARDDAYDEAFGDAEADARQSAHARGLVAGKKVGTHAGEAAGTDAGGASGSDSADAELAAAEAAERAENCGAPLFVTGYCPTDEEIARENQAEALCGPGTEEGREEAAAMGIECGVPGR
jgi:hypothetical protein